MSGGGRPDIQVDQDPYAAFSRQVRSGGGSAETPRVPTATAPRSDFEEVSTGEDIPSWQREALGHVLSGYQGLTAGTGKHIIAGLRTLADEALPTRFTGADKGVSLSTRYRENLGDVQTLLDSFRGEHPIESTAEEIVGSLPTMGVGGGSTKLEQLLARVSPIKARAIGSRAVPSLISDVATTPLRQVSTADRLRTLAKVGTEGALYGGFSGAAEAARPESTDSDIQSGARAGAIVGGAGAALLSAIGRPIAERFQAARSLGTKPTVTETTTSAMGGLPENPKAIPTTGQTLNKIRDVRQVEARTLFDAAEKEADGKPYPDVLRNVLQMPAIQPHVAEVLARENPPKMGTMELVDETKKLLSDEIVNMRKQIADRVPRERPRNELRAMLSDAETANTKLIKAISDPSTKAAVFKNIPLNPEAAKFAQIMQRRAAAQEAISQGRGQEWLDRALQESAAGEPPPSSMQVQVAPPEAVSAYSQTYRDAVDAYRTASLRVKNVQQGHKFMDQMISGSTGTAEQQGFRGEEGLTQWLRGATADEKRDLILGMAGDAAAKYRRTGSKGIAKLTETIGTVLGHGGSGQTRLKALENYIDQFPREYQRAYQLLIRSLAAGRQGVDDALSPSDRYDARGLP